MIIFLILFFLFAPTGHSAIQTFLIEGDDSSVIEFEYNDESSDSIEEALTDAGLSGKPMTLRNNVQLPAEEDRKYWRWFNNQVEVNQVAKQQDILQDQRRQERIDAVKEKLNLSDDEFEDLKDGVGKREVRGR
jgi:hypothetical protein